MFKDYKYDINTERFKACSYFLASNQMLGIEIKVDQNYSDKT